MTPPGTTLYLPTSTLGSLSISVIIRSYLSNKCTKFLFELLRKAQVWFILIPNKYSPKGPRPLSSTSVITIELNHQQYPFIPLYTYATSVPHLQTGLIAIKVVWSLIELYCSGVSSLDWRAIHFRSVGDRIGLNV